jgi:hypothetical protein
MFSVLSTFAKPSGTRTSLAGAANEPIAVLLVKIAAVQNAAHQSSGGRMKQLAQNFLLQFAKFC